MAFLFGEGLSRHVEFEVGREKGTGWMARIRGHSVLSSWMAADGVLHDVFDHIRDLPPVPGEIHAFAVADYLRGYDASLAAYQLKADLVDCLIDEFEEDVGDVLAHEAPKASEKHERFASDVLRRVGEMDWYGGREQWTPEVVKGFESWYAAGRSDAEKLYGEERGLVVERIASLEPKVRRVIAESAQLSQRFVLSGDLASGWEVRSV